MESVICNCSSDEEEPEESALIHSLVRVAKTYVIPLQRHRQRQQHEQALNAKMTKERLLAKGLATAEKSSSFKKDAVLAPPPLRQIEMARLSHALYVMRQIAAYQDTDDTQGEVDGEATHNTDGTPYRATYYRYRHNLKFVKVHHWISLVATLHRQMGSVAGLGGSLSKLERYATEVLSLLNVKVNIEPHKEADQPIVLHKASAKSMLHHSQSAMLPAQHSDGMMSLSPSLSATTLHHSSFVRSPRRNPSPKRHGLPKL